MMLLKKPWRYALTAALLLASYPAAATVYTWSQTAASNSTSDATINWAEGQAPSTVNDSARAMMAAISKWRDDLSGTSTSNTVLTVAGSTTAYTLTTNQSLSSLTNGFTVTFKVGSSLTNGAAVTLAVDGLTAKKIQGVVGTDLVGGELVDGSVYTVTYQQPADAWILHGVYSESFGPPAGTVSAYAGTSAPSGYLLMYGQCVSTTTYAALYAVIADTYDNSCAGGTFGIPDLRGRVVAGQDDMGGTSANRLLGTDTDGVGVDGDTLGGTGGEELTTDVAAHDHTDGSLAFSDSFSTSTTGNHSHDYSAGGSSDNRGNSSGTQVVINFNSNRSTGTTGNHAHTGSVSGAVTGSVASTGDASVTNIQPTIILNYIIKF